METVCDTWLFKNKESNVTLNQLYLKARRLDFTPLIKAFTDRLDTIPIKFSKSEEVSGSICFYGGVFISLLNYGYIEEIEGLFTFALCYMLIDHFVDDDKIDNQEKDKTMKEIYLFITKGEKTNNKLLNAAADRYLELIQRVPKSKEYFIKLFNSEIEGVKVQNRKDLDRSVYLRIADEKGGLTASVIAAIIGLDDKAIQETYEMSSVIQMVDDFIDLKDDTDLGIYTLARYDIDNNNMDDYIRENIIKIGQLSSTYNFFKPILLLGLILGVHDNPNCVSETMNNFLKKYDIFSENTSKDSLVHWFHDKLYKYISSNIHSNA